MASPSDAGIATDERRRLRFEEYRPPTEVAANFGYTPTALDLMISRSNSQLREGSVSPFFLRMGVDAYQARGAAKIATDPMNPPSPINES
jgi:hypothetical protein